MALFVSILCQMYGIIGKLFVSIFSNVQPGDAVHCNAAWGLIRSSHDSRNACSCLLRSIRDGHWAAEVEIDSRWKMSCWGWDRVEMDTELLRLRSIRDGHWAAEVETAFETADDGMNGWKLASERIFRMDALRHQRPGWDDPQGRGDRYTTIPEHEGDPALLRRHVSLLDYEANLRLEAHVQH